MLVASLLLVALGLAGCTSGADDPLRYPSSTSATAGPTTNSTDNSTAAPADGNTTAGGPAPSANLTATPTNGTAPLNVTFNLTGSTSGGSLAWSLDVDGDNVTEASGATLPASFNHTYAGNGTFNATLTVSDGSANATAVVQVVVAASANGTGGPPIQTYEASWILGAPGCALVLTGTGSASDGIYGAARDVDPATWGRTFTADFDGFGPDNLGGEMFFFVEGQRQEPLGVSAEPGIITGEVPEGADLIAYRNCGVQGMSVTYSA